MHIAPTLNEEFTIGENDERFMFRIMKDWRSTREVGNEIRRG